MSFQNKKVVITGAGRDFGQTLSIQFAKMGAEIFLSARTIEGVNKTADLIREVVSGAKISTFQADLSKPADAIKFAKMGAEIFLSARTIEGVNKTADLIREVVSGAKISTFQADLSKPADAIKFARDVSEVTDEIDILVNNAAYWLEGNIAEVSDEDILETINSTATGSMLITKHFLPLLNKSVCPDVVFINSTASLENNTHATCNEAFSAAKAAQSTFSDRLRNRLKGSGIRFMCIYPPNFDNISPINEQDWSMQRGHGDIRFLTARNIFESIKFALTQDRICSIDKIILSNNSIQ